MLTCVSVNTLYIVGELHNYYIMVSVFALNCRIYTMSRYAKPFNSEDLQELRALCLFGSARIQGLMQKHVHYSP